MDDAPLLLIIQNLLYFSAMKEYNCIQLSAFLHAALKFAGLKPQFVTGDLLYEGGYLFEQKESLEARQGGDTSVWNGHAWVMLNGVIYDLSICRTAGAKEFSGKDLLRRLGNGIQFVHGTPEKLEKEFGLVYRPKSSFEVGEVVEKFTK